MLVFTAVFIPCHGSVASDWIEAGEAAAVQSVLHEEVLKIPIDEDPHLMNCSLSVYNIVVVEKVGKFMWRIDAPPGVKYAQGPSHRNLDLVDADGRRILSTFIKDTWYDYYGSSYFDEGHPLYPDAIAARDACKLKARIEKMDRITYLKYLVGLTK